MSSYQNLLNKICEKIIKNRLKYKNTILIGDNSVGKSELLKRLIELDKNKVGEIYYLDAVNRQFSVDKVDFSKKSKKITYNPAILEQRLEDRFFNLLDSFNLYNTNVEGIEDIYKIYEEQLQSLIKEFLGINIKVEKDIEKYILIDGEKRNLSSGFQAIVRIFLELIYYQDTVVKERQYPRYIFIIDEVDEYLAPKNSYRLLPYIIKKFPYIDFIITTHSEEVIAGARDFNIIALTNKSYEILDSNDFQSIIEINALFLKTFNITSNNNKKSEIDSELRRLFNNRISGELDESDKNILELVKREQLTKAQEVLVRQIEEW